MKYLVVVDAFLSSNSLAGIAFQYDVKTLHVFSSLEKFQELCKSVNFLLYEKHFICQDFEALCRELSRYKVIACLPGSDSGILLAEYLSKIFCKDWSNVNLSRDRYLTSLAIGQYAAPNRFKAFAEKHGPCVVKPRIGLGGIDRVRLVSAETVGDDEPDFFISPQFVGTEYSVDLVSYRGKHLLTGMFEYVKFDGLPLKRRKTILVEDQGLRARAFEYVKSILDTVGYEFGATHTEIILDRSLNFNLVEVNWRCQGQMALRALRESIGLCQPDALVQAVLGKLDFETPYTTKAYLVRTNLFNDRPRQFSQVNWEAIQKVPTWKATFHHFTPIDELPVSDHTLRLMTAKVVLSGEKSQVLSDEQEVQRIFHG